MLTDDLAAVNGIAAIVHPGFPEDAAVFAERLKLHPTGCRMLAAGPKPFGYLISHPWKAGTCPALNSLLGALPADADTYYIHDLALAPAARGAGAAGKAVADIKAHALALGLTELSLIAVNGSDGFWRRHGFVGKPADPSKLASYGAGAQLMACTIA